MHAPRTMDQSSYENSKMVPRPFNVQYEEKMLQNRV